MRKVEDLVYDGTVYDVSNLDEIIFPYKAVNILVNMYKDLQVEINRLCTQFSLTPVSRTLTNITDFPTLGETGVHIATAISNNNIFIDAAEDVRSTLQTILADKSTYNIYGIAPTLSEQVVELTVNQTYLDAKIINSLQRNIKFMIDWMKQTFVIIDKVLLHESLTTIAPTNVTYAKVTGNTTVVDDLTIAPIGPLLGDVASIESTYMDRAFKARQNLRYLSTDGNYYVVTYDFELELLIGTKKIANGSYPTLNDVDMIASEPTFTNIGSVLSVATGWSYEGNFFVTHQIKSAQIWRNSDDRENNGFYCKSERKDANGNVVDTFIRRIYLASSQELKGQEIRAAQSLQICHYSQTFMFTFHAPLDEYGYAENKEIYRFFAFQTTFDTSTNIVLNYRTQVNVRIQVQKIFVYSYNGEMVIRTLYHGDDSDSDPDSDDGVTISFKVIFNGSFRYGTDYNNSFNDYVNADMIIDASTDTALYWSVHFRDQNNWKYGWLKVWKDSVVTLDSYIQFDASVTWTMKFVITDGVVKALWKRSTDATYSLTDFQQNPVVTTTSLSDRLWNLFPAVNIMNRDNEGQFYEDGSVCYFRGKTFVYNRTLVGDYITYINSLPTFETGYFTYKRTINGISTELIEQTGEIPLKYRIKHNAVIAQNIYIFEE